jgi:hypothetical protein
MIARLKVSIKRVLPEPIINAILRMKWEKMKAIDLSYIPLIREKEQEYLLNPEHLQTDLLPKLGLNNEQLYQFPEELYPYCGYGLHHWQYPNQFSKYLVQLAQFHIESYLEIGVRHGGTFVITVEYLNKFHPLKRVIGVDIGYAPSLIDYKKWNPAVQFYQADTQTLRFKEFIKKQPSFDLVLIDGSHEEEACRTDFATLKEKANIIVLHDIVSTVCPGVIQLWNELKTGCSDTYLFFEYTDQYQSVKTRTGKTFLGIGMAVKKAYLLSKGINATC